MIFFKGGGLKLCQACTMHASEVFLDIHVSICSMNSTFIDLLVSVGLVEAIPLPQSQSKGS